MSLKWMLENDITGVIENTFTDEQDVFGVTETVELKRGGAAVAVTEANKHEYVRLIVRHRLLHGIVEQVVALRKGFGDIVPPNFMEMFDQRELELMICGLAEINLDGGCTACVGFYRSPVTSNMVGKHMSAWACSLGVTHCLIFTHAIPSPFPHPTSCNFPLSPP